MHSLRDDIQFMEAGVGIGRDTIKSPLSSGVGGVLQGKRSWVDRMKARIEGRPRQGNVPARRLLAARPTLRQVVEGACAACEAEQADFSAMRAFA